MWTPCPPRSSDEPIPPVTNWTDCDQQTTRSRALSVRPPRISRSTFLMYPKAKAASLKGIPQREHLSTAPSRTSHWSPLKVNKKIPASPLAGVRPSSAVARAALLVICESRSEASEPFAGARTPPESDHDEVREVYHEKRRSGQRAQTRRPLLQILPLTALHEAVPRLR